MFVAFRRPWLLCALLALASLDFADQPFDWRFGTHLTYETGQFGTGADERFVYFPFSIARVFPGGEVAFVVPYVVGQTSSQSAFVNGRLQRIRETRRPDFPPTGTVTNGGQGDISIEGAYTLLKQEDNHILDLELLPTLKFPTADDSKGLGTGKFDGGGGVRLSHRISEHTLLVLGGGYSSIGSPSDTALRNQWSYQVGWRYHVTQDMDGMLSYHEYSALLSGEPNPRSILLSGDYVLDDSVRFFGGAEAGLSQGSADVGITAGVRIGFNP